MNRITVLRSYLNAKYYHGHIRWLLITEKGDSVYCDKCGNIANAVMVIKTANGDFNVPLCKYHFEETFPTATQVPDVRVLYRMESKYPATVHPINYTK